MLKRTLYVGLPILLILLIIYYYLGGFNETKIKKITTDDYIIAGYSYRGPYKEDALQNLFFQAKDLVETGSLEGPITVLNYKNEFAAGDSIHQLIGVRLQVAPKQMPENMQLDTIPGGQVLRAVIQAHPLVMPHPEDTQEKIVSFSNQNSLPLKDISIEQYVSEKELWVDVPIR